MHFLTRQYTTLRRRYKLAAFNIEQAVQLYIKAKLLELLGEFPRTHSLVMLLRGLSKVFRKEGVERFVKPDSVPYVER